MDEDAANAANDEQSTNNQINQGARQMQQAARNTSQAHEQGQRNLVEYEVSVQSSVAVYFEGIQWHTYTRPFRHLYGRFEAIDAAFGTMMADDNQPNSSNGPHNQELENRRKFQQQVDQMYQPHNRLEFQQ